MHGEKTKVSVAELCSWNINALSRVNILIVKELYMCWYLTFPHSFLNASFILSATVLVL